MVIPNPCLEGAHSLVGTNLETHLRQQEKGQRWTVGILRGSGSHGELSGGGSI